MSLKVHTDKFLYPSNENPATGRGSITGHSNCDEDKNEYSELNPFINMIDFHDGDGTCC